MHPFFARGAPHWNEVNVKSECESSQTQTLLSQQNVGGFHHFIKNIYKWNVLWTRANPELLLKDPETY